MGYTSCCGSVGSSCLSRERPAESVLNHGGRDLFGRVCHVAVFLVCVVNRHPQGIVTDTLGTFVHSLAACVSVQCKSADALEDILHVSFVLFFISSAYQDGCELLVSLCCCVAHCTWLVGVLVALLDDAKCVEPVLTDPRIENPIERSWESLSTAFVLGRCLLKLSKVAATVCLATLSKSLRTSAGRAVSKKLVPDSSCVGPFLPVLHWIIQ